MKFMQGFNENIKGETLQRKIYVDEFWAKISDQEFTPPPRTERASGPELRERKASKSDKVETAKPSTDEFEDRYSYTPHESQQLLTKLRGIFENLLQSDALGT